jgi:hypothetical protein
MEGDQQIETENREIHWRGNYTPRSSGSVFVPMSCHAYSSVDKIHIELRRFLPEFLFLFLIGVTLGHFFGKEK